MAVLDQTTETGTSLAQREATATETPTVLTRAMHWTRRRAGWGAPKQPQLSGGWL